MWWGTTRFRTAKNLLKQFWLIEVIKRRDDKWVIIWSYIKINFIISSINKDSIQTTQNPSDGQWQSNTLIEKTNTLIEKKEYTSFCKTRLLSFGLSINYIENNFEYKKSLERIIEICENIKYVCNSVNVIPIYNKDTINTTDIMLKEFEVDQIIDHIKDQYLDDCDDYQEVIRSDYWLPYTLRQ